VGAFRRLALGIALAAGVAAPALAHRLVVYAYAEGGEIVVEAKFSSGALAKAGEIRVLDAQNARLVTVPLEADGETRLPLPEGAAQGVTVEVETDKGHQNYWVLTPADLGLGG
jgi:nickel transport protein